MMVKGKKNTNKIKTIYNNFFSFYFIFSESSKRLYYDSLYVLFKASTLYELVAPTRFPRFPLLKSYVKNFSFLAHEAVKAEEEKYLFLFCNRFFSSFIFCLARTKEIFWYESLLLLKYWFNLLFILHTKHPQLTFFWENYDVYKHFHQLTVA